MRCCTFKQENLLDSFDPNASAQSRYVDGISATENREGRHSLRSRQRADVRRATSGFRPSLGERCRRADVPGLPPGWSLGERCRRAPGFRPVAAGLVKIGLPPRRACRRAPHAPPGKIGCRASGLPPHAVRSYRLHRVARFCAFTVYSGCAVFRFCRCGQVVAFLPVVADLPDGRVPQGLFLTVARAV